MLGTRRLSREEALLCRTARIPGSSAVQPPIELADGLDWDAFWNLALRHEVQPLAWAFLRSNPEWLQRVPAPLAQAAERRYFASAVRNAGRRRELASVLDVLRSAGIPVIPVKGVVLDEGVYGPDVPRTFDDLDVLVHRSDLSRARAELGQLGYHGRAVPRFEEVDHRFHDVQLFRPTNGAHQCLEVHWDLWPASRFGSIVDDLWRRARPGQVAGTDALPNRGNRRLHEAGRSPRLRGTGNVDHEVAEDVPSVGRVDDLGMELDAIQVAIGRGQPGVRRR